MLRTLRHRDGKPASAPAAGSDSHEYLVQDGNVIYFLGIYGGPAIDGSGSDPRVLASMSGALTHYSFRLAGGPEQDCRIERRVWFPAKNQRLAGGPSTSSALDGPGQLQADGPVLCLIKRKIRLLPHRAERLEGGSRAPTVASDCDAASADHLSETAQVTDTERLTGDRR